MDIKTLAESIIESKETDVSKVIEEHIATGEIDVAKSIDEIGKLQLEVDDSLQYAEDDELIKELQEQSKVYGKMLEVLRKPREKEKEKAEAPAPNILESIDDELEAEAKAKASILEAISDEELEKEQKAKAKSDKKAEKKADKKADKVSAPKIDKAAEHEKSLLDKAARLAAEGEKNKAKASTSNTNNSNSANNTNNSNTDGSKDSGNTNSGSSGSNSSSTVSSNAGSNTGSNAAGPKKAHVIHPDLDAAVKEHSKQNYKEAFELYQKVANGHTTSGTPKLTNEDKATAMGVLAIMYEKGMGVDRNADKARFWNEEGAKLGDMTAALAAGKYHAETVKYNTPAERRAGLSKALSLYEEACDKRLDDDASESEKKSKMLVLEKYLEVAEALDAITPSQQKNAIRYADKLISLKDDAYDKNLIERKKDKIKSISLDNTSASSRTVGTNFTTKGMFSITSILTVIGSLAKTAGLIGYFSGMFFVQAVPVLGDKIIGMFNNLPEIELGTDILENICRSVFEWSYTRVIMENYENAIVYSLLLILVGSSLNNLTRKYDRDSLTSGISNLAYFASLGLCGVYTAIAFISSPFLAWGLEDLEFLLTIALPVGFVIGGRIIGRITSNFI